MIGATLCGAVGLTSEGVEYLLHPVETRIETGPPGGKNDFRPTISGLFAWSAGANLGQWQGWLPENERKRALICISQKGKTELARKAGIDRGEVMIMPLPPEGKGIRPESKDLIVDPASHVIVDLSTPGPAAGKPRSDQLSDINPSP